MSDFLLDTDVLIRCLRGVPETLELARSLTEEGDLHVSVWSHLEIMTLADPKEEKRTLEFLTPFILHPINDPIAHRAALLLKNGAASERPLAFGEAVVAATAIQHGLILVTYSSGNLPQLSELKIYPLGEAAVQRGVK